MLLLQSPDSPCELAAMSFYCTVTCFNARLSTQLCEYRRQWLDSAHGSQDGAALLAEAAAEEAAAAAAMGVRRVGAVEDLRCLDEEIDRDASAAASRYDPMTCNVPTEHVHLLSRHPP